MATGVLPLCIGKSDTHRPVLCIVTERIRRRDPFRFATTTYDREGEPTTAEQPLTHTREEIEASMRVLTGAYEQKPPRISAKKMGGIPSYKLARRGFDLEPEPVPRARHVVRHDRLRTPAAKFSVWLCSPGTYVRTLAHDLGLGLGCGAHLGSLRRLRSGDFTADQGGSTGSGHGGESRFLEALLHRASAYRNRG
jgi:tRNA pseudouridine55 synthase